MTDKLGMLLAKKGRPKDLLLLLLLECAISHLCAYLNITKINFSRVSEMFKLVQF